MSKEKIEKLGELIENSKKILLINHVRMDMDAFGSLSALYYVLKKIGYTVKATNDENIPEDFSFLGANDIINPNLDIKEYNPDLIISFDAASLGQLGNKYIEYEDVFKQKEFVVIDHHISNPAFGKLNIIDTDSSSTCEIIWEIIKTLDFTDYVDKKIATLLTSGLLTDTNIYYNANTTPKTLRTGAELMEYHADFRLPMFEFYKKKQFKKTKLWGEVLKDIKQEKNGKIVYAIITPDLFKKTNTTDKDSTGLINEFLANIEGVDVGFLLYPTDSGIKASFRSNNFNVSELCQSFGGGGHKLAAGFTLEGDIYDIKDMILEKLKL